MVPNESEFWTETDAPYNRYESYHKVPQLKNEQILTEVEKILNLGPDEVRKLTSNDCFSYSVAVAQFSYYIQKLINTEESRHTTLEHKISHMISSRLLQQNAYDARERRLLAIEESPQAKQMELARATTRARIQRLQYTGQRLDLLANMLKNGVRRTNEH